MVTHRKFIHDFFSICNNSYTTFTFYVSRQVPCRCTCVKKYSFTVFYKVSRIFSDTLFTLIIHRITFRYCKFDFAVINKRCTAVCTNKHALFFKFFKVTANCFGCNLKLFCKFHHKYTLVFIYYLLYSVSAFNCKHI